MGETCKRYENAEKPCVEYEISSYRRSKPRRKKHPDKTTTKIEEHHDKPTAQEGQITLTLQPPASGSGIKLEEDASNASHNALWGVTTPPLDSSLSGGDVSPQAFVRTSSTAERPTILLPLSAAPLEVGQGAKTTVNAMAATRAPYPASVSVGEASITPPYPPATPSFFALQSYSNGSDSRLPANMLPRKAVPLRMASHPLPAASSHGQNIPIITMAR
ncbi:hypothetical protein HGRIS_000922 [Hohenbuehelia grisea]|uniref:Uncharacterized protein n=1 Tax=Hohenbuehelia grisea TaxID=104357 RepID=A0ABR3IQ73_9AGAR